MITLCAVSYLNTKPFLAGLEGAFTSDELTVELLPPSACAEAFFSGEAQIALVPVGALLGQMHATLLPGNCIGAVGKVDSVFLVSNEPIDKLTTIYADPDSRTSNGLTRVLLANHWKQHVTWVKPDAPQTKLKVGEGAVLIGDKAIGLQDRYPYVYDLAAAWQDYTGLPFAFAVWLVKPEAMSIEFLSRVQQALSWGFDHLAEVAQRWASGAGLSDKALLYYYQHSISYVLDDAKLRAIEQYLTELAALEGVSSPRLSMAQLAMV
jgi:chorismate dehydratase